MQRGFIFTPSDWQNSDVRNSVSTFTSEPFRKCFVQHAHLVQIILLKFRWSSSVELKWLWLLIFAEYAGPIIDSHVDIFLDVIPHFLVEHSAVIAVRVVRQCVFSVTVNTSSLFWEKKLKDHQWELKVVSMWHNCRQTDDFNCFFVWHKCRWLALERLLYTQSVVSWMETVRMQWGPCNTLPTP